MLRQDQARRNCPRSLRAVDKLYWSYTSDCGRMPTLQITEISEAT
jgi:hypothetical protein